jgi:hypothetical protein
MVRRHLEIHIWSPTKDKRKQRPEIRLLALRLPVKAKLDKILWPCTPLRKPSAHHSRHFRREPVRVRADYFHARHLVQTGPVRWR